MEDIYRRRELGNPYATRPLRSYVPEGFTFVVTPNVGRIQNVEPVLTLQLDEEVLQITETHLELLGRVEYFADARKTASTRFDWPPWIAVTHLVRMPDGYKKYHYPAWPTDLLLT